MSACAVDPACFLNRLALDTNGNLDAADAGAMLETFFMFHPKRELLRSLRRLQYAAMTEHYSYTYGAPGELLFTSEAFEKLIELSFLLVTSGRKPAAADTALPLLASDLPVGLSGVEWQNPMLVMMEFFTYKPIREWKLSVHMWLTCAVSAQSVADSMDPAEVLPYCRRSRKLVEAAFWFVRRMNPE